MTKQYYRLLFVPLGHLFGLQHTSQVHRVQRPFLPGLLLSRLLRPWLRPRRAQAGPRLRRRRQRRLQGRQGGVDCQVGGLGCL